MNNSITIYEIVDLIISFSVFIIMLIELIISIKSKK
ncbi:MAG: putative holin-like toxin [Oscillospiraceae bacterium]|nr:putative holin-like toxin [Oscillospiraceae bacterium]